MMECFGISCFEEPKDEEEELVAEEAPRKKASPPKKLKKKRSVKFAAPAEKSSKKLIPAPPPSPRPVCSLPPPTDVVWGPLVDMMPLTPAKSAWERGSPRDLGSHELGKTVLSGTQHCPHT